MTGGTLELATSTSVNAYNLTVNSSSTINSNRATGGAGVTYTLGTLDINGAQTLSIVAGSSATSGTAGVTFGATTIDTANTIFNVGVNANATANLTLGALSGNFSFTKQGTGQMTLSTASGRTSGAVS